MGRYHTFPKRDLTSVTAQDAKSLTEILDEYSRTGQLDSLGSNVDSYDFDSAEDVDFNKEVAHDVDIYDAASGQDDPYMNLKPVTSSEPSQATTPELTVTSSEPSQATTPELTEGVTS